MHGSPPSVTSRLLWVDGVAGLTAGIVVLALREWLAALYDWPGALVTFLGGVNLAYGAAGVTLATVRRRSAAGIGALALANLTWCAFCLALVSRLVGRSSGLGLAHLLAEGAFVAALGTLEWRNRHVLVR